MFCLFGYTPLARKEHLKKNMATSFISDAIFASLKTQFEDAMRTLVQQIATGEGLDASELESKYLVNLMGKAAATPAAKRAAKVTVTDSTSSCSCTTAKGKPCALKPLVGTTMCRLHTKKADTAGPSVPPVAAAKEKKKSKASKKKSRETPPLHTHELDEHTHEDCELCQTHGNPLGSIDEEGEEFERVRSPKRTLRDRLSRVVVDEPFLEEDDD